MIADNDLSNSGALTELDQREIAWKTIQEQGLADVDKTNLSTLSVPDYSKEEIKEDANAIDWDMAFTEVENGEKMKQDRAKKDAEEKHNAALEQ